MTHLNSSSLAYDCRQNNIDIKVSALQDVFPYVGEREPVVDIATLEPSVRKPTRTVLIVCGMRARHFLSTDICVRFIEQVCAGEVSGAHTTRYIVAPMVDRRVRDLMIDLWPEMRAESPRPWQEIYLQVPDTYRRVVSEIISGAADRPEQPYQCFDGSYHLTLLDQNFPSGWIERLSGFEAQLNYVPTAVEDATLDRLSGNGQLRLSDPETRILMSHISVLKVDTVIEVTHGPVSAVIAPYESPILYATAEAAPALDRSAAHAKDLAKNHCPVERCVGGTGNVISSGVMPQRSGTIGDSAIKMGLIDEALVIQVGHISMEDQVAALGAQRGAQEKVMRDCMGSFVPRFSDVADDMIEKWSDLLGAATR